MLVVNIFAGPGTGKSTCASLLFGKLKVAGINAEYVSEFAKDLTWEGRSKALECQPYIMAKQLWKLHRLQGQVEVAITDSPLMLAHVYGARAYSKNFGAFVFDAHKKFDNLNFHLQRDPEAHPFNPKGRSQDEEEAKQIDTDIFWMLSSYDIVTEDFRMEGEITADRMKDKVLKVLAERSRLV